MRNLLAVSVEAQLRELYGEPWPQQVQLQQQFLRPQTEAATVPFNHLMVPIFLFSDAAMIGLLFIIALIFMEKEEGTLMAYLVTPGRVFEYLLSKALSLALLAVVFTAIFVPPILGMQPNYLHLLAVMVVTSIFTSLLGAWLGLYFENLNQAMFPMVGLIVVLGIPAVAYHDTQLLAGVAPVDTHLPDSLRAAGGGVPLGQPRDRLQRPAGDDRAQPSLLAVSTYSFKRQVARA